MEFVDVTQGYAYVSGDRIAPTTVDTEEQYNIQTIFFIRVRINCTFPVEISIDESEFAWNMCHIPMSEHTPMLSGLIRDRLTSSSTDILRISWW